MRMEAAYFSEKLVNVCQTTSHDITEDSNLHFMFVYLYMLLPVVLYRCETWSLTLREEHRPGGGGGVFV
jgi:hypothetical protein